MMLSRRFSKKRHMTREQRAREEAEWKRINEEIALESEGVEPLIDSFTVYANETIAMLLGGFVLIFLYTFEETQIPVMYNIKKSELIFYIMFTLIMVPFTLLSDSFLHMTQELHHGWKVYDFVAYQKYRFSVRDHRWQMEAWDTLDESIAEPLQTVDMLCFSSQFYFMASIHGFGMLLVMFGLTIQLRQFANPFSDQMLPVIITGMFGVCTCINWLCRFVGGKWMKIWLRKSLQGTVDDEIAAKLAIGEGRQADLEAERLEQQALNSERFRHRFLDRSRPWVLQHLVELLTPRTLQMPGADGRPVIEYIRDVYQELMNLGEGRRRPGDREDISSDSGDEGMRDRQAAWSNAPLNKPSAMLLKHWLELARRRRALKKLIDGTIKRACGDTCALCGRTTAGGHEMRCNLAKDGKASDHAIDDLIKGFELKFPGRKFEPNLWTSFFRQEASFITRCSNCVNKMDAAADAKKVKRHTGGGRQTRADDITDSDDEDDEQVVFEPMVVTRTSAEGKVMSKWLNAARRRLGGVFPRPNARAEMEEYAAKMRAYKLKKDKKERKAKGFISDDEDEDGEIKLKIGKINAASKALAQKWLSEARIFKKQQDKKRRSAMLIDLKKLTVDITTSTDWYFGTELRLSLESLVVQGDALEEKRRELTGAARMKQRNLEDDLEAFKVEKETQAEMEVQRLEEGMREQRTILLTEQANECEGVAMRKTKAAMLMEKEAKLAEPGERAVLVNTQKKELKRFDKEIEGIRTKYQNKIDHLLTGSTTDLSSKSRRRDEAMQSKTDICIRKIKIAYDDVDKEMLSTETAWLSRSSGVVFKSTKKLESKAMEDKKKIQDEKDAVKRRKRG
jgi:heme/copper-type cytochrome/quinol oxidase subunit 4